MSFGKIAYDYGPCIDFDRLRKERLERANQMLHKHGLGSVIIYEFDNMRYCSSALGHSYWYGAQKRFISCALLIRDAGFPYVFAGPPLTLYKKWYPWLENKLKPELGMARGHIPPQVNDFRAAMFVEQQVKPYLKDHGVSDLPVGIDLATYPLVKALQDSGLEVVNGQPALTDARMIKTEEEIELLRLAGTMVEAAYTELVRELRPGLRENDMVAIVAKKLYEEGCDHIEGWVCCSGPRTNPNNYEPSFRMIRPGDMVFIDVSGGSFAGYRTCYYRTFIVGKKPTEEQKDIYQKCLDMLNEGINALKPGITTLEVAQKWPNWDYWGFETKEEAQEYGWIGNAIGHGIGIGGFESPIISREILEMFPKEWLPKLEKNMVIAMETWYGPKDGQDGARIEDLCRITDTGVEVLYKFPKDELIVCGEIG
ncbi:MAG: M24 family metallopeptidase [Candidatus Lokiarchaeia archaeon]